jgi:hypothetical protein
MSPRCWLSGRAPRRPGASRSSPRYRPGAPRCVLVRRGHRPGSIRPVPSPRATVRRARRRQLRALGFLPAADRILKEGIAVIEVTRNHTGDSLQDCSYRRRCDARCHALAHRLVGVGPHLLDPRRHSRARSTAAHTSAEASSARGASPCSRRSAASAHRFASAARPASADTVPASAASIRCCSIAPRLVQPPEPPLDRGDPALPTGPHYEARRQASDGPRRARQCWAGSAPGSTPAPTR